MSVVLRPTGHRLSAIVALAFLATVGAAWFGGGGPGGVPTFGFQGGRDGKDRDLSGAMPGTYPQPYFGPQEYAPGVVVVTYHEGTPLLRRHAMASVLGLYEDPDVRSPYFHRYHMTPKAYAMGYSLEDVMQELLQDPSVRTAEYDFRLRQDQVLPNDPRFGELYGLHNTGQSGGTVDADIDAPEAWQTVGNPAPVLVAVMDDGLQLTHPDLVGNLFTNPGEIPANGVDDDANGFVDDVQGWDFSDGDNNVSPAGSASHGVHTTGTVGAVGNNGIGVVGVARSVKLMHVRMYGGANDYFTAFTNGIDYARIMGARVITASYNIDGYPTFFADAIVRARNADIVYCNSAGNNNQNNPPRQSLRTLANNVIFVAATDRNDNRASFSNYGTLVEIAAPGVDILSTIPNGYGLSSGTSMATPHVAGAAAVLRSRFPTATARQILDRLIGTADPKPSLAGLIAGGRLNLNNALDDDTTPPSDPTDLQWLAYATSSIKVSFKGSGDDGTVGQASYYDIRMSNAPIHAGNFNSATQLNVSIPPVNAGVTIYTELAGLDPGTSVYLAVVAVDNLGNRSGVLSGGPFTTKSARTDNVESSTWFQNQTGTWATTTSNPRSGTRCWTDSPTGNYPNNANMTLLSRSLTVPGQAILYYYVRHALASGDFLYCDVSQDGGATWTNVSQTTGTSVGYRLMSAPLTGTGRPSSNTANVRVRFRLTSNASGVADGVYLDDFFVVPVRTVLLDTMEGAVNFTPDSPWALTTVRSASPIRSWHDSPGGNYANNVTLNLTGLNATDTSNLAGAVVTFKAYVDTELNYDYLRVSTSTDGGSWVQRGAWSGTLTSWNLYAVPAGPAGMVRVRFTLTTDGSVVRDGVYVDDLAIMGEPFLPAP